MHLAHTIYNLCLTHVPLNPILITHYSILNTRANNACHSLEYSLLFLLRKLICPFHLCRWKLPPSHFDLQCLCMSMEEEKELNCCVNHKVVMIRGCTCRLSECLLAARRPCPSCELSQILAVVTRAIRTCQRTIRLNPLARFGPCTLEPWVRAEVGQLSHLNWIASRKFCDRHLILSEEVTLALVLRRPAFCWGLSSRSLCI